MTNAGTSSVDAGSAQDSIAHHTEAVQLSMLSSVLNGLEGGASKIRQHAEEAMRAVRSGTYVVDAAHLSRLIIGEALGLA